MILITASGVEKLAQLLKKPNKDQYKINLWIGRLIAICSCETLKTTEVVQNVT